MNKLHLHLTDDQGWRVPIDAFPLLTAEGARIEKGPSHAGYYTKEDIGDIVEYAGARGIEVVPEIDIPGHTYSAVSTHPWLCCTGAPARNVGHQKDVLCPGRESTFEFLDAVFTSLVELFPSRYVHIGGDEAPRERWESCEMCARRMDEQGLTSADELHGYLVRRIAGRLAELGREVIGWEEVLSGDPDPTVIIQWWRHRKVGDEPAREALRGGHRVIASPNSFTYLSFPTQPDEHFALERTSDLRKVYTADYAQVLKKLAQTAPGELLGIEGCCWTEYLTEETIEPMIFPRVLALAQIMRENPEYRDYEELARRVDEWEKSVRRP